MAPLQGKTKVKRKGVHAKSKHSKSKHSKNYTKPKKGQGKQYNYYIFITKFKWQNLYQNQV